MSTKVIIFSRDRACQLDALLSSLRLHVAMDPLGSQPVVLWTASDAEFGAGYAHAMDDWPDVRFVRERDFPADLDDLLPDDGHVMFLCDDDLAFRAVNLQHAAWELDNDPGLICFSLRLGSNTHHCFPLARDQVVPAFADRGNGVVDWVWVRADADFGYAFSCDAHVWRVDDLRELMDRAVRDGLAWHNPNTFEDAMARVVRTLGRERPRMMAYRESALVGVPINRVQSSHENRIAEGPSAEWLNAAYRAGERIVPLLMDVSRVNGAHCHVPFVFSSERIVA